MFKRNKNKEYNDPLTIEFRETLSARLTEVDEAIELIGDQIEMSYHMKMNGLRHDGEHNIFVDDATQNQHALAKERQVLLRRLERINAGLAHTALYGDISSQ